MPWPEVGSAIFGTQAVKASCVQCLCCIRESVLGTSERVVIRSDLPVFLYLRVCVSEEETYLSAE